MPPACTHVVAGAVTAADGRILIAQRPPGKHLAGGWEFPGGKLEAGESRVAGLARELAEELGIAIREPRPLIRVRHAYPSGEVLIDMWVVSRYSGDPRGLDGQALKWLTQEELERAELLAADRPIVRALRLPERLRESDTAHYRVSAARGGRRRADEERSLLGRWCSTPQAARDAAASGADFLVMDRRLAAAELRGLSESLPLPLYSRGIALESAWESGSTGVNEIDAAAVG